MSLDTHQHQPAAQSPSQYSRHLCHTKRARDHESTQQCAIQDGFTPLPVLLGLLAQQRGALIRSDARGHAFGNVKHKHGTRCLSRSTQTLVPGKIWSGPGQRPHGGAIALGASREHGIRVPGWGTLRNRITACERPWGQAERAQCKHVWRERPDCSWFW